MSVNHGVMIMRRVENGPAIPAGGTAPFLPGGRHLLLLGVKAPFRQGEMVPLELSLEKAGTVGVELKVDGMGASGEHASHVQSIAFSITTCFCNGAQDGTVPQGFTVTLRSFPMRRFTLSGSLAALALTAGLGMPLYPANAQQTAPAATDAAAQTEPFSLPALPYAYDALAPIIDAQTMELHHSKHQQAFVTALNNAAKADPQLASVPLKELVATAGQRPPAIRNNAGGHWNHTFFWQIMAPEGQRGEPSAELTAAINEVYGSMDEFKKAFQTTGTSRFGSGWAWLIVDGDKKLAITSTPNQDNPLMDVAEKRGTPVLGNDVWEHAYYLTYNNRRADYLSAWWETVNWTKVSENYANALAQ